MKIHLSFSSWSTWKQCPQRFKESYIEHLATESSLAADFGSAFHKLLDWFYSGSPSPRPLISLPLPSLPLEPGLLFARYSKEHLERLFTAYADHWKDDKFQVIGSEIPVTIELAPGIFFNCVIDLLAKTSTGEIVVIEHKTTGNLFNFDQKAFLSLQGVIYILAAEKLGHRATGVIFNGINTSYGKSHKKLISDPASMFSRTYVSIEEWQKDEAREIFTQDAKRILEDIKNDTFTKNAPGSCLDFFQLCPFAEVCKTPPEDRPEFRKSLEKRQPHKFKVEL